MSSTSAPVSLIVTVLNEGATIDRFMASVTRQSRVPDEIVVVDGGSTDDTVQRLGEWQAKAHEGRIRVIVDPSCSRQGSDGPIARGRNRAIRESQYDIIACADAGCEMQERWLETITSPFADPAVHVVGGWYLARRDTMFRRALAASWVISPDELDPNTFIPSSRSLAFRRSVWASVGGYSEHSLYGEDTLFIEQAREQGYRVVLAADALVEWEIPEDLRSFARLAARYGFGDGYSRIRGWAAATNGLKSLAALALLTAGFLVHWSWLLAMLLLSAVVAVRRRPMRLLEPQVLPLVLLIGVLKLVGDAAYLAGHLRGRGARRHPLIRQEP
jgi:glycosyltransferase involved in cell wall biosynthesis